MNIKLLMAGGLLTAAMMTGLALADNNAVNGTTSDNNTAISSDPNANATTQQDSNAMQNTQQGTQNNAGTGDNSGAQQTN